MLLVAVALVSYLVGAVPFGYLVARARGVDILRHGSGNIGATNVGRVLGRRWGVVVFLLDFAKGAVPVLVARGLGGGPGELLPVVAGVAAFLGHLFPVYLRFRGGKGVATAAGVVAVLVPAPFLAAFLCWLTVFVSSRTMSLASLSAAGVLCLFRLAFTPLPWAADNAVVTGFCLAAAAMVVARHHANVRRLLAGTENRFPESPAMTQLTRTLHVLAVGLWFGTAVFFTLAGGVLFGTFDRIAAEEKRPAWLPVPPGYDRMPPGEGFPRPLRREQGARVAGAAVGPLFPWYYGIQTGCALVALVTALAWTGRKDGPHRLRVGVLAAALVSLAAGWWLYFEVEKLRLPRDAQTDALLANPSPEPAQVGQAEAARAAFTRWHLYSLADNFVTLLLAGVALALAARLPGVPGEVPAVKEEGGIPPLPKPAG
jgi:acyl-phosphate glycerol 3-phosphate acyltransferase